MSEDLIYGIAAAMQKRDQEVYGDTLDWDSYLEYAESAAEAYESYVIRRLHRVRASL